MASVLAINPYKSGSETYILPVGKQPQRTSIVRILIFTTLAAFFLLWTCGAYSLGYMDGWEQGMGEQSVKENTLVAEPRHRTIWGGYESKVAPPATAPPQ